MPESGNVIDISSVRAGRNRNRPTIQFVDKVARSGAAPALGRADDGHSYWIKFAKNNPQGPETVVNEVVASVIGKSINAPVAPWSIVDVPIALRQIIGERIIEPGPAFGSRVIHSSEVDRMEMKIPNAFDDGNVNRIPRLMALWGLCNALDVQAVFDGSDDMKIYSIDHGYWFGSYPYPWSMGEPSGFPEIDTIPELRDRIPDECWESAISDLDGLTEETIQVAVDAVPEEWGFPDSDVINLVEFAISRKKEVRREMSRYRKF